MDLVSSDKRFGKWLKCAQAFCNHTRQTAAKDRSQSCREQPNDACFYVWSVNSLTVATH